ncbi:MAG: hypothetical protein GF401_04100 [Chitinivibrionales bacterium]|nr:hypothetical protein [Chitinivibrionales bacterium]
MAIILLLNLETCALSSGWFCWSVTVPDRVIWEYAEIVADITQNLLYKGEQKMNIPEKDIEVQYAWKIFKDTRQLQHMLLSFGSLSYSKR